MVDVGAEVGHKMRLAIKAKLTELNCYVDDELPDYIMVMIANKRTKSQMKEDLSLFLANETSFFVEWLHIVLKKLKQVHVTNPNVFKNPIKRKSNEFQISQEDYKKVKKEDGKIKKEKESRLQNMEDYSTEEHVKSLTDDLPITANRLSEAGRRKIVLFDDSQKSGEDEFDIPLLSEINASNEEELVLLERRIKNVKNRLGLQVESDKEEESEDDKDCLNIKHDPEELEYSEQTSHSPPQSNQRLVARTSPKEQTSPPTQTLEHDNQQEKRSIHTRIIFDKEKDSLKAKYDSIMKRTESRQNRLENRTSENQEIDSRKRSILDRLGKRPENKKDDKPTARTPRSEVHSTAIQSKVIRPQKQREEKKVASILSRVGVLSKVSVPKKPQQKERHEDVDEDNNVSKNVASVVKVKPRILPVKAKQANPSLLFKAVAEAQRSVTQTPAVGKVKEVPKQEEKEIRTAPALFTKKYKELAAKKLQQTTSTIIINKNKKATLLDNEKLKLRLLLSKRDEIKKKSIKERLSAVTKQPQLNDNQSEHDEELNFDDFDSKLDESESPSRTPELPRKNIEMEEKEIFLKSKITIENTPNEATPIIDDSDEDNLEEEPKSNHKFIVTLDGIDKFKFAHINADEDTPQERTPEEPTMKKTVIKTRRVPSPIVFDAPKPVVVVAPTKTIPSKPAEVPNQLNAKKIKEKCKYFPNCRQAERCEFLHPVACKMFPNCKFADLCIYTHPMCKFEMSCTRKSCPYSHSTTTNKTGSVANSQSICKFFPNCSNSSCVFFHPKMCKFGMHCKNAACVFQHPGGHATGAKLTWRLVK